MSNYTAFDTVILCIYLLAMLGIGIFMSKRKKDGELYNKNGTLGTFVLCATICATMVGGTDVIGTGGIAYSRCLDIFVMSLPYPLGILLFSTFSGRIQKLGVKYGIRSIPQLMELRYGKGMRYVTGAIICFSMAATCAASISAMATIFSVIGDEVGISYTLAAVIATAVLIIYTCISGFSGVVWTDVVQFVVLTLFVFVMIPIVTVSKGGGITEVFNNATSEMLKINMDGFFIGNIFVNIIVTFCAAEVWQRSFAAKDAKTATKGVALGATFFTITLAIVCLTGLAGYKVFPNIVEEYGTADAIIPAIAIRLLPTGLSGLALAGIFAVAMSSGDSFVQLASQSLSDDILRERYPNMSKKKEMLIYRISIALFAIIGLVLALYIRAVFEALMFAFGFYASCMGFPAVGALLWKKATKQGIYASIIGGLVSAIIWLILGSPFDLNMSVPSGIVSLLALVIVSLATYKKHPAMMPTPD